VGQSQPFLTLAALDCELRAERLPVAGQTYDVQIVRGADPDDGWALSDIRAMLDVCNLWGWN